MQDGLAAQTQANNLLEEAVHGVDAATSPDEQTCQFLQNSEEAYERAKAQYLLCQDRLDAALQNCSEGDWSSLSASPEHCGARVVEIQSKLSIVTEDIARSCGALD